MRGAGAVLGMLRVRCIGVFSWNGQSTEPGPRQELAQAALSSVAAAV